MKNLIGNVCPAKGFQNSKKLGYLYKKHCDIRNYLRDKVFLSEKQDLRLKDANNYLVEKLSLPRDEKPAKSKAEVVDVWEKHLGRLRSLE